MGSNWFKSLEVLFLPDERLHLRKHDDFGKYPLQIASGQLEDHSPIGNAHNPSPSLHQPVIQHIFALELPQFAFDFAVLLKNPIAELEVDHIEFIVHLTGRHREE